MRKSLLLAKFATIRDSVEWLGEHSPDLIFSDIQLSDGLSFRIFEQLEVNTPVIFTTAYDQYAIKAFEINSIAYFQVQDKSVFIKTKANQNLAIDHSLDKLEEMLDPRLFFRINRKYIVHLHSIDSMYTLSKSRMKPTLPPPVDEDIYLSFKRSRSFKNWLNQ